MFKKNFAVLLVFASFTVSVAQGIDDFDFPVTDIHGVQHNCADYLKANHWILIDVSRNP